MTKKFIVYDGSGAPVKPDCVVVAKLRCGIVTREATASAFGEWTHNYRNMGASRSDIVGYKVVA